LAEAVQGSVGGHESPFEEAVAEALTRRGWTVVPQIGVSRFRIDLGVVHPDRPGDYFVGVECDGATYHSAATARDRDKVRAAILEGLGWRLIRTWSTDWWVDREGAADRLHLAIEAALTQSREGVPADQPPPTPADQQQLDREISQDIEPFQPGADAPIVEIELAEPAAALANYVSAPAVAGVKSVYRTTDFEGVQGSIDASQFYELAYEDILVTLIGHVLDFEAPISESQLVQRIARAHGFKRAGRIIRDRVMQITKRHFHVPNASRAFVWLNRQQQEDWCEFRLPDSEADVRQIEDIAPEELRAAASACATDDREVELARSFGIRRLSSSARQIITLSLRVLEKVSNLT
jgi:hypothetical protein